jgi:hypothetical protein
MSARLVGHSRGMTRLAAALAFVVASLVATGTAGAAQLIDRNATGVKIAANAKGEGLLTYHAHGKLRHVLLWGALGANVPTPGGKQQKLKVDYAGGYGKYRTTYWKTFANTCGQYDGPAIPNMVAACRASDGTYWAAQSWPQPLPNLGYTPWLSGLRANWLEVSHWAGDLAQLEVQTSWVYGGRFEQVFGRMTYGGSPVYGYGTTRFGAPTDGFGVLIYLDTFNSIYGSGWRRENSFVPHNPTGVWCYGFYPFDPTTGGYKHPPGQTVKRGPGTGERYRLTASGPGVTPNISVLVPGLHPYDPSNPTDVDYERQQAATLLSWGDKQCRAGLS